MISSLMAFIVGGLFVGYYYSVFVLVVFILKLFKKDGLSLMLYLLYLLSIGYFLNVSSIYTNWEVLFFIAIPSVVVLMDILKDDIIYNKYDIILAFLFLLSYLNEYLFMLLILGKLFISLYNEINLRGFFVYILFIGIGLFVFINNYSLLNHDYLNQVIVLIALGFLSFFGFVIRRE